MSSKKPKAKANPKWVPRQSAPKEEQKAGKPQEPKPPPSSQPAPVSKLTPSPSTAPIVESQPVAPKPSTMPSTMPSEEPQPDVPKPVLVTPTVSKPSVAVTTLPKLTPDECFTRITTLLFPGSENLANSLWALKTEKGITWRKAITEARDLSELADRHRQSAAIGKDDPAICTKIKSHPKLTPVVKFTEELIRERKALQKKCQVEQNEELEALQAIFSSELSICQAKPTCLKVQVVLQSIACQVELCFLWPPTYPLMDNLSVKSYIPPPFSGRAGCNDKALQQILETKANELHAEAAPGRVFSLVDSTREWMEGNIAALKSSRELEDDQMTGGDDLSDSESEAKHQEKEKHERKAGVGGGVKPQQRKDALSMPALVRATSDRATEYKRWKMRKTVLPHGSILYGRWRIEQELEGAISDVVTETQVYSSLAMAKLGAFKWDVQEAIQDIRKNLRPDDEKDARLEQHSFLEQDTHVDVATELADLMRQPATTTTTTTTASSATTATATPLPSSSDHKAAEDPTSSTAPNGGGASPEHKQPQPQPPQPLSAPGAPVVAAVAVAVAAAPVKDAFMVKGTAAQHQCMACLEPLAVGCGEGMTMRAPCEHCLCRDCWDGYLLSKIDAGTPFIKCPGHKCTAWVDEPLIMALVSAENYRRYRRWLQNSLIQLKGWKWCPNGTCTYVSRKCNEYWGMLCTCQRFWCYYCGKDWHWPVLCENSVQYRNSTYVADMRRRSKLQLELEKLEQISVLTKPCPKCQLPWEKNGGCNHFTCTCGHQFCWVCLKNWSIHGTSYYECKQKEVKYTVVSFRDDQAEVVNLNMVNWFISRETLHISVQERVNKHRAPHRIAKLAARKLLPGVSESFLVRLYGFLYDCHTYLRNVYIFMCLYQYYLDPEREKIYSPHADQLRTDLNLFEFFVDSMDECLIPVRKPKRNIRSRYQLKDMQKTLTRNAIALANSVDNFYDMQINPTEEMAETPGARTDRFTANFEAELLRISRQQKSGHLKIQAPS